ncbi:MAG: serine/threonine protein phosphatase [Massilibacillus sp.]|nr:serine/threonine protein phosphatase [Massilibacillus sp.]
MNRIIAIGDIHGEYEAFIKLLHDVKYDYKNDKLILLGDYIDRGKQSKEVLDKVMSLVSNGAIALLGNHEDMMIDSFINDNYHLWHSNGGDKTHKQLNDKIVYKYLHFIKSLPISYELDGFFFCHAGVDFSKPIKQQSKDDLLWIRDEYIFNKNTTDKVVVSGHTPVQMIKQALSIKPESTPIYGEDKIFLDTGVAYGGRLTAMDVLTKQYWQVEIKR